MAKDPNNYDPYERKRDIKQLEKSYLVLRERREMLGACGSIVQDNTSTWEKK